MTKDIGKCIWKEPIMNWISCREEGIKGMSLNVRECYQCDGYMDICDRYNEGITRKKLESPNWLGLDEDYLK